MPGVEAAALAPWRPLDLSFSPQNVLVSGLHGPADRGTPVDTAGVSADYFDTLGVPLLQGRTFATADTPQSPRVAIVSEAMALRFRPDGTAVGQRFCSEPVGLARHPTGWFRQRRQPRTAPRAEPTPCYHPDTVSERSGRRMAGSSG